MMDSVHSLHQPPSRHHGPRIASRVCTPCALRKRKCDKTLPRCMTCTKIKKICHYGTPAPSPSDNFQPPTKANEDRQKSSPEGPASSPRTVLYNSAVDLNVPLTSYLYLRDPFRLPEARRSIVNATIAKDVSKIVGTVDEVKSTALDYFNSIHPWMPVVSRTRFFSRLPQIWLNPQADFILLAFCMFLVIQIPGQDHLESMQSSLYAMAKGLIALVESADILSIEVVQTRLLVSIYELGHGIDSGAFISIGACARSGIALGIHRTLQQQAPGDAQSWVELEEQRRVWWGIYILDQFANLDKIDRPPTFTDLTYLDYLPVDDEEWNNNIMPSGGPLTVSTSSSIRVGCFAREAQLSHLLSRVLRNVYDASPNPAFNREEALQLHRALDTMTALLPTESAEIRKVYAAVISMCHSARLVLGQSPYLSEMNDREQYSVTTLKLIKGSARRLIDHSNKDRMTAGTIPSRWSIPFGAKTLYQTAIMLSRLGNRTGNVDHEDTATLLKNALSQLNIRWRVAGKYLIAMEELVIPTT